MGLCVRQHYCELWKHIAPGQFIWRRADAWVRSLILSITHRERPWVRNRVRTSRQTRSSFQCPRGRIREERAPWWYACCFSPGQLCGWWLECLQCHQCDVVFRPNPSWYLISLFTFFVVARQTQRESSVTCSHFKPRKYYVTNISYHIFTRSTVWACGGVSYAEYVWYTWT